MANRHTLRSFELRHRYIRSDVGHARKGSQTFSMEGLVARQVRDRDPKQIVEGTCNVVDLEHLGQLDHGLLETLHIAADMALQLDCREYRE